MKNNAKKINSSELTLQRDNFLAESVGCLPFTYSSEDDEYTLQALNESISEIEAMIDHFIRLNNTEEVSFFRKMLQRTKTQKRQLKARMIEKMNAKELAIA